MQEDILTLEEISEGLQCVSLRRLSKKINMSYPTLYELSMGNDKNYKLSTLFTITKYLINRNVRVPERFKKVK